MKIQLEGIELYGFHGCFAEEQKIGQLYLIDVELDLVEKLHINDQLTETIDYQMVYEIVKMEMNKISQLLEDLGQRIAEKLMELFPKVQTVKVRVEKPSPPIPGKVKKFAVTIVRSR